MTPMVPPLPPVCTTQRCPRSALRLLCGLAVGLIALASTTGCYSEGGPGYSADLFTYVSTPTRPYTVTLRDTRTGQDFWSVDVPVGKQLVVSFDANEGTKDKFTPDKMSWLIMEPEDDWQQLTNSLPVPPAEGRRLDVTLRATPEFPDGMNPNRKPPAAPKTPGRTTK